MEDCLQNVCETKPVTEVIKKNTRPTVKKICFNEECRAEFWTWKDYKYCLKCRPYKEEGVKEKVREQYMKFFFKNYEKLYPHRLEKKECIHCKIEFKSNRYDKCKICRKKETVCEANRNS